MAKGASQSFVYIIRDMLEGENTEIATADGKTPPIVIGRGVKQGCPLSGPLFNISLDQIIREAEGTLDHHDIMAYADDLILIRDCPASLQEAINEVKCKLHRLNVCINQRKSRTLCVSRSGKVTTQVPNLDGQQIPTMGRYDIENCLGKSVGFSSTGANTGLAKLLDLGRKLTPSSLALRQRIDALKTFFFPSLLFHMRMNRFKRGEWKQVDAIIRAEVKRTLNVPDEASNIYIYGPRRFNCIGLPNAADLSDIAKIDTAFKLLTAKDKKLSRQAKQDIETATINRGGTIGDTSQYLAGSVEASNDPKSAWSAARSASRSLGISWNLTGDSISVNIADKDYEKAISSLPQESSLHRATLKR